MDALSCASIKLKGTCFWIKCTIFGCKFKSTAVIEHYTPDVFVSVYDSKSPEKISGKISDAMASILPWDTTGAEQTRKRDNTRIATNYRIADVFGSPSAQLLINVLEKLPLGLACKPGSTPYKPYMVSKTNPLFWNTGLVDGILNIGNRLTFNQRTIGERRNGELNSTRWGGLYPRSGVVVNQDHYKASAVIAQRAMDIVTNGVFGIYRAQLDGPEGRWYLPALTIEEWMTRNGKWQMLYPQYETGCHILGEERLKRKTKSDIDGWSARRSDNGDYVWHYWRRYECCKKPSGYSFIGKIRW